MSTTGHTSDPMADHWEALTQAIRAERDAHRERAEHAKARTTDLPREISRDELQALPEGAIFQRVTTQEYLGGGTSRVLDVRFHLTSLLAPDPDQPLLDAIAAEVLRQKADAWDEGYTSGHSRAMRRMSDEPNVEPGTNPYRAATPPTTTEETTHE